MVKQKIIPTFIVMTEIFHHIPKCKDYLISNHGRVMSYRGAIPKILKARIDDKGRPFVTLYGKHHKVSHLVASVFLGVKPNPKNNLIIDHIDNNPANNRADNLQLITIRENSSKDNIGTSGYTGVTPSGNKYKAQIRIDGIKKYLGTFDTPEDAHAEYLRVLNTVEQGGST